MSRARLCLAVLPLLVGLILVPSASGYAATPGRDGRILFDDFMTGQIYSINPDGTGLVQLTHLKDGRFARWPHWSPDGTHVAFSSLTANYLRLWIMDADGRHAHIVARDAPGVQDFTPTYTPDGTRLVFTRCRPDPPGGCGLFSIKVDGTQRLTLTPTRDDDVVDFGPAVSPDGRRIAFARFNAGGITAQVYVMRSDGSGARPVTAPALEAFAPGWSPDGRHITFSTDCCRLGSNIYSMNDDGSGLRHLTNSGFPNNDSLSVYSPSGDRIAFVSDRRYDDFCCDDLFVMKANGRAETLIHTGLTGVESPDWGPPLP